MPRLELALALPSSLPPRAMRGARAPCISVVRRVRELRAPAGALSDVLQASKSDVARTSSAAPPPSRACGAALCLYRPLHMETCILCPCARAPVHGIPSCARVRVHKPRLSPFGPQHSSWTTTPRKVSTRRNYSRSTCATQLYFKPGALGKLVVESCPLLMSVYKPSPVAFSGHVQTLVTSALPLWG